MLFSLLIATALVTNAFAKPSDQILGEYIPPSSALKDVSSSPCGSDWATNWNAFTCIKVVNDKKLSFDDARKECKAMKGDLVTTIKDEEELNFVKALLNKKAFWIGIQDDDKDDTYTFVDGKALGNFTPFGKDQPKTCMAIRRGRWYNRRCGRRTHFICEKGFPAYAGRPEDAEFEVAKPVNSRLGDAEFETPQSVRERPEDAEFETSRAVIEWPDDDELEFIDFDDIP